MKWKRKMKIFFFYIPFWSSSLAVVVVVVVKYFFHNEESFNAIHKHTHKNDSNTTKNRYVLMFQKPMYSLYIQIKARIHHHSVHLYIYTRYMLKLFFLSIFIIVPESMVTVLRQKQTNKYYSTPVFARWKKRMKTNEEIW